MDKIIKKIIDMKLSIVTAESITGGLVAKTITDIPGASNIFKKGYIVYSNESKVELLNVDPDIINKNGVVSNEVAYEMAKKLYEITKCDICISTTGNAGPTICDNKPIGRVYIGIAYKGDVHTYECNFHIEGSTLDVRSYVRNKTNEKVFDEINKLLN